jgi:hypothetical protein
MIISASRSPKNDSMFARRRSITKGRRQQLSDVVQALKAANDKVVFEEFSASQSSGRFGTKTAISAFSDAWGFGHMEADRSGVLPVRKLQGLNLKLGRIPNAELKADFKLMMADFARMRGRFDGGAKDGYICVFVGNRRLELIASKWGYNGGGGMTKHHFYHWQAVAGNGSMATVAPVDDVSADDDSGTSQEGEDMTAPVGGRADKVNMWEPLF